MNSVYKQTIRNNYNIIYNPGVYDIYNNTYSLQTSIRSRIEEQKTLNLLHELDQKFSEWKIDKNNTENEENCPVCYEQIKSNNYITPKCGHKLCLYCYKQCILSGGECANKCCLCRGQIL